MIENVIIGNFKCFRALDLRYGNLTLLTGFNGSGKSTALQPLLLLAQALHVKQAPFTIDLNGAWVNLGTAGDIFPEGAQPDGEVGATFFTIKTSLAQQRYVLKGAASRRWLDIHMTWESPNTGVEPSDNPDGHIHTSQTYPSVEEDLQRLIYISAVRAGTSEAAPVPSSSGGGFADVGMDGSFAGYWYHLHADEIVPENRRHPDEPADSYRRQLDAWLGTLFPGAQVTVRNYPDISVVGPQFKLSSSAVRKPSNIGYGLSYAFPILVALLSASEGQTVVIDSPEAHLHPSAQSRMGKLLAHFAAAGVQIIVETHSDHLLNGVRVAVKRRVIQSTKVVIHFFGKTDNENIPKTLVLDEHGFIEDWPSGFFDQIEADLAEL